MNNGPSKTWDRSASPTSPLVSIPLTSHEIEVVQALRRLKPYGAMKVTMNQTGSKLTVTIEESIVVEVKNAFGYGTMRE